MHAAVARNDGPLAELSAAYGHQGNAGHNMKLCIRARKDRVLMPLFADSQWLDIYSGMRRRERTAKLFKAARNAKKKHTAGRHVSRALWSLHPPNLVAENRTTY